MKPLLFFISLLVFALILLGVRDYVRHKQVMGERVEALEQKMDLLQTRFDANDLHARSVINEVKAIVEEGYSKLVPMSGYNKFIPIDGGFIGIREEGEK